MKTIRCFFWLKKKLSTGFHGFEYTAFVLGRDLNLLFGVAEKSKDEWQNRDMKCPNCNSTETVKNGRRKERQSHMCKHCGRQFLESYRPWRYSDDVRQLCIKMYLNGMGLRGIERVTNIHHTTVMHWIHAGHELTDAPASDEIPEITDLDELQTFVGKSDKKSGSGLPRITGVRASWLGLWETGCGNVQALVVD